MKLHFLAVFLPTLALLSCDHSEVVDPSTSKTFTLAPRIVSANGISLPAVDSVRIAVLNANSPTASPYYDKSLDYKLHGDTIEGIPQNAQLEVRVSGVKIQRDSSRAVWWSGRATATFSGTQTVDAQSLPVPVFTGDTTAPHVISRAGDTIESTDTTAHLVWHIREDSAFTAVANGDTLRRFSDGSDSVVWQHTWAGNSLPVSLLLRDKTGNLSRDSLTVTRRDRVAQPVFGTKPGSYADTIRVSLSDSTFGTSIQYSLDGGSNWATYDTALLLGSNATINARATKIGMTGSAISSAAYLVQAATPTFSVATGTSSNDLLAVKLSSLTPAASLLYSLDTGKTWKSYADSIVLGNSVKLQAKAMKAGLDTSAVGSADYTIQAALPVITGAPSGTYNVYQTLRLATTTPNAKIRYTLDGTEPVDTSSLYTDSVLIDTSCTIKAKVFKTGLTSSLTASAQYALSSGEISTSIPTTSTLWYTRKILLTSDNSYALIHCTTDGSDVGLSSPLCNDSITVEDGATIKATAYSAAYPKIIPATAVFTYPSTWNTSPEITYGILLDSRDGKSYRTVKIGAQTWMAENLNYRNVTGSSDTVGVCYNGSLDTCQKYGRLYSWVEAMGASFMYDSALLNAALPHQGICPSNWHIPSDAEWSTLDQSVDSSTFGTKLKSTVGWPSSSGTDVFGFRVLPAGLCYNRTIVYLGTEAYFWSSSERNAISAWSRNYYYSSAYVHRFNSTKSYGYSLRCVKDN